MRSFGNGHQGNLDQSPFLKPLSYDDSYTCPVCRHGQLNALVLIDAFACSFCRHIFTADLIAQSIRLEDNAKPLQWKWVGRTWQPLHPQQGTLTVWTWFIGFALVIVPSTLVWLSYHTFPPLPDSSGAWLPLIWIALTFGAHASIVLWLFLDYFQLPAYVALKIQIQRWRQQW